MKAFRALVALLALSTAAALGWIPPARGQTGGGDHLALASQTPWVAPGGVFALRVQVTTQIALKDVELATTVFRRVQSRSEFALTVQNRVRAGEISTISTPLSELTADAAGAYPVQLNLQDPSRRDRTALAISVPGVYPVRVELRSSADGRVLDRFVTHLVLATPPDADGPKLGVALVLPVHSPPVSGDPAKRPEGTPGTSPIEVLAAALAAQPSVPLTVLPTPETLESLGGGSEADRAAVASLVSSLPGRQLAQTTYVAVNLPVLARDLDAELSEQLDRGGRAIEEVFHARADPRLWIAPEPLDDASIQRLRDRGVDHFVLPEANVTPIDVPVTPTQPFELAGRSVRRPALLVGDAALNSRLEASGDPVLAAHQLLADLAVLYNDRPGHPRTVVAVAPQRFAPTEAFIRTLLDGMATSPILAGQTIDQAFTTPSMTTSRGATVVRSLVPAAPTAGFPTEQVRRLRVRVDGLASMLDSTNPVSEAVDDQLLKAEAVDLDRRQRTAQLDAIDAQIRRNAAFVEVPPERTVVLTARTGEIPLTISSTAPYPVHVQLRIESDKLLFPQYGRGRSALVPVELTRPNTTRTVQVEARAAGSFPLRVRLQSPDGGITLAASQVTVRSTATSTVGIVLTSGALGFLVLWWGRHLARGRRNRRLVPA